MPFRMEMSGFARIPGSLPIISDIGTVWPIIASKVAEELNLSLNFISHNQSTEAGQKMREWIVDNVHPLDREQLLAAPALKGIKSLDLLSHSNGTN